MTVEHKHLIKLAFQSSGNAMCVVIHGVVIAAV